MSHQKKAPRKALKEDPPPQYSVDDCPPDYYDIYPDNAIPLSSLAKVTPPDTIPPPSRPPPPTTTTTSATNTSSVSNRNAVVSQPSASQPHNIVENQEETWIAYILWKLLLIMSIIALIIIPLVGLHAVIWSCISYHQRHNLGQFGRAALKIAIILCIASYAVILFVALILLTVFVFVNL